MNYQQIILNKGKEASSLRFHPWIFSGAIAKKEFTIQEGEIVEVFSYQKQYLGTGYYANGSIAVRFISFEKITVDGAFWFNKINAAYNYRKHLGILNLTTNVFRLFFGEGDGASGLILDYYNGHVVFQAHSWGIYLQKEAISNAIIKVLANDLKSIYDKSAETLPKQLNAQTKNDYLYGEITEDVIVKENSHVFKIDFIKGQKTGFFIDQRDNRNLLAHYSKNKTVLNTFCYTGGFSIYAAATAKFVHSVDSSASAVELCNLNFNLNNLTNNESFVMDTFDFLKDKKDVYDVIVLDPPAFAKSRESKHNAITAYKRLNATALKFIKPNGILFTFSCSGVVDKYLFYNTITSAAIEAKRNVRVLHYLHQPPDHPVTPNFPEGEYLKGMVLWVE